MYALALLLLSAGAGLLPALIYVIAQMNRIRALYGAPRQDNAPYYKASEKALRRFYVIWVVATILLLLCLPSSGAFPDTRY